MNLKMKLKNKIENTTVDERINVFNLYLSGKSKEKITSEAKMCYFLVDKIIRNFENGIEVTTEYIDKELTYYIVKDNNELLVEVAEGEYEGTGEVLHTSSTAEDAASNFDRIVKEIIQKKKEEANDN